MVQRGGKVSAYAVETVSEESPMPRMEKRILPASIIYTDEFQSYRHLAKHGYDHRRIHHATGVYVSGDIHTNTIEGFWSLVKNGIRGSHHAVSAKHLQGYLNEYVSRDNHRDEPRSMFELLLLRSASPLT